MSEASPRVKEELTPLPFFPLPQDSKPSENMTDPVRKSRTISRIQPRSSAKYTWELPAETNKRLKLIVNGKERMVDVMEIGILQPFRVTGVSLAFSSSLQAGPELTELCGRS